MVSNVGVNGALKLIFGMGGVRAVSVVAVRFSSLVVVGFLLSSASFATAEKIERNVGTELTQDEISVYSYILKSYRSLLKPTYRDMLAKAFYLNDETEPLNLNELLPSRGCLRGLGLERKTKNQIPTVHTFVNQTWLPSYVKLTKGAPCKGSPSEGMCYETEGTLSLTEIDFDKSHTHAVVGFGVRCGLQCGWGQVVILKKVDGRWQRTGPLCEEWYI
jgi:hypothetical protein